ENFNVRLIMAMASTGLCSGGSVAFLPDRNLSYAYNALIILPAGFALIILGENRPLGFMIFLYFFYLFLISTRGNKEYWNAMENDFNLREKTGILENLSRTDVLTGLYNRRHFDEVLGSEWKRASRDQKSFSMAIGDIDHFKIINDNHGHLAGDEYLKYVAGAFKEIFKRESDFVARYGGEEFVVLLPDTNSTRAFELTEILRKKMEKGSIKFNRFDIKATISFGVASVVPNYTDSSTTLISRADAALYKAKMNGRNRIEVA
ncbi:GGDEF domain-containing protein, partial [bacterium]|nr:GGDEF domain-containing protein [bacterium]